MLDKRHVVLYGLVALGLVVLVGIKIAGFPEKGSYTAEVPFQPTAVQSQGTSSASTTGGTESAPAQQKFALEVVTDLQAQERGLGGRTSIPQNYGMLFVFREKSRTGFWMKGMLTSIDMIWLADDGTIVSIDDSVTPESYNGGKNPVVFYPPEPVRYVLETRAGEARRQGWRVGSHVPFTLP